MPSTTEISLVRVAVIFIALHKGAAAAAKDTIAAAQGSTGGTRLSRSRHHQVLPRRKVRATAARKQTGALRTSCDVPAPSPRAHELTPSPPNTASCAGAHGGTELWREIEQARAHGVDMFRHPIVTHARECGDKPTTKERVKAWLATLEDLEP